MRKITAVAMAIAFTASSTGALAHGIWIAQRHDDWAVVYGHGASDEGYDPAKLEAVAAFAAGGEPVEASVRARDDHVLLDLADGAAMVTARLDNGFWTQGPDGTWVNPPKSAVPEAKQSGHYLKYTTTILEPLQTAPAPAGLPLEIVPLVDPMTLAMGDALPIRVLHEGEPLEGATIIAEYTTASDERQVTTDAQGEAVVEVRNQGLNVIGVSHATATPSSPDADEVSRFATLAFTLDFHSE